MMEAGADFTDGLRMRDGGWELTIRPDANTSALQVEANAPDAAAETAQAHGARRKPIKQNGAQKPPHLPMRRFSDVYCL